MATNDASRLMRIARRAAGGGRRAAGYVIAAAIGGFMLAVKLAANAPPR